MSETILVDPSFTYTEAAEYVNLSLRQFRRVFIDSGVLPIVRTSPRRPRVRLSALNICLSDRTYNFAIPQMP
jgi:excisionase family DNA binding protein